VYLVLIWLIESRFLNHVSKPTSIFLGTQPREPGQWVPNPKIVWVNPIIRGVSGLRSVGLLRSDTKRFGDGVLFDPQKRNLNSSNRCTFEGVSGLQSGGPFRRYMFPHGRLPLGRWKYPQL